MKTALEMLRENSLPERKQRHEKQQKKRDKQNKLLLHLLHKLMRGDGLTGEEGRQICWDLLANADILKVNAMTGNSQTYHILGQQSFARGMLATIKAVDLKLAHQMEMEAMVRDQKLEEEIDNDN